MKILKNLIFLKSLPKEYKIYINYILWIIKVRDILPSNIIKNKLVNESQEKLVDIRKSKKLLFSNNCNNFYVREEVSKKLEQVADSLPNGIYLKIYEMYRPLNKQTEMWEMEYYKNKKAYPDFSEEKIVRITRMSIAYPVKGMGGHQTGGAIDLTLSDKKGKELDMGTKILEFNKKTKTKNRFLNLVEKQNRKILLQTMNKFDFNNFPCEWWHYSYGDKMWATYKRKKYAIYGPIEEEIYE